MAATKVVGYFVRTGLQRAYETAEDLGLFCNPELGIYPVDMDFASVDSILCKDEAILSGVLHDTRKGRRLISDLIDASAPDMRKVQQGGADWLEGGAAMLVLRDVLEGPEFNRYRDAWERFKQTSKFHSRFFDQRAGIARDRLLKPLESFFPAMTTILAAGSTLVRARRVEGKLPADAWKRQEALGPPPVLRAAHSRMSPQGISYLYLCDKEATAVAEIRPDIRSQAWVAQFVLKRALKVFDCTKIPEVKLLPIFDPKYEHDRRWAGHFFEQFGEDISEALTSRANSLAYIPMQVFAEFVRAHGFDGLRYRSSQEPNGVNVTLFCGPADDVANGYVAERPLFHEWVRLQQVSTVTVRRLQFELETVCVESLIARDFKNSRTEQAANI